MVEEVMGTTGEVRRLDLGGELTLQGTDGVVWNCVPETRVILSIHVTH